VHAGRVGTAGVLGSSILELRWKEVPMKGVLSQWLLILLCFSFATALGGGFYEHVVLTPLWSKSPPSSFSVIQPGTGVPLQRFWIPVHAAITLFIIASLALTWGATRSYAAAS